jgi:hypothetical protein
MERIHAMSRQSNANGVQHGNGAVRSGEAGKIEVAVEVAVEGASGE